MGNQIQTTPSEGKTAYARLDRLLLYLLTAELGYFILLMIAGVIVTVLVYATNFAPDLLSKYRTAILWPVAPYLLTLPLNLFGGFAGGVLNIRSHHEGYPGTGHLLNWIFLATTSWLFLLTIVFLIPSMARTY